MSNFKIFSLILLSMFTSYLFSQEEDRMSNSKVIFSVNYFKGLNIGDNFLNKAHDFQHGVALDLNFKVDNKLFVGMIYNQSKFEVTNRELVGEYSRGNLVSFGLNSFYVFDISKKINICPQLSLGVSYFNAEKTVVDIRNLYGLEGKIGAKAVYELGNKLGLLGTIQYSMNRFDITANPEIKNFFNQSHSINFGLGIILF